MWVMKSISRKVLLLVVTIIISIPSTNLLANTSISNNLGVSNNQTIESNGSAITPSASSGTSNNQKKSSVYFVYSNNSCDQIGGYCFRKNVNGKSVYYVYENYGAYKKGDIDYKSTIDSGTTFTVTLYNNKRVTSVKEIVKINNCQYIKSMTYYNSQSQKTVRYDITNYVTKSSWTYRINREVIYVNGVAKTFKTYFDSQNVVPNALRSSGTLYSNGSYKYERFYSYGKSNTIIKTVSYNKGKYSLSKGYVAYQKYYSANSIRLSYEKLYTNGNKKVKYTYYASGKIKSKTTYNSKGKPILSYQFATNGRWIKRSLYYSNGKVKNITDRTTSGRLVDVKKYNSKGRLTYKKKY